MISEGSCDTEDWNNNAENLALITAINYVLLYIHNTKQLFKIVIIFHNITVFVFFIVQINAALLSRRDFF